MEEERLVKYSYDNYSNYYIDYFNKGFDKSYKLEDDGIYGNQSKANVTWIGGSKYPIYPQHIPGYKAHVPHMYAENIHGMGYSKATAKAIKEDIPIGFNYTPEERYKTISKIYSYLHNSVSTYIIET
jgi:hypothetical protein